MFLVYLISTITFAVMFLIFAVNIFALELLSIYFEGMNTVFAFAWDLLQTTLIGLDAKLAENHYCPYYIAFPQNGNLLSQHYILLIHNTPLNVNDSTLASNVVWFLNNISYFISGFIPAILAILFMASNFWFTGVFLKVANSKAINFTNVASKKINYNFKKFLK